MSTLIKFQKLHHDEELKFANKDLAHYNGLLSVIKKQVPGFNITIGAIANLLENPAEFAFDIVVGDNPLTIAGARVNKKKAMDLIELPDNWKAVIKAAEKLNRDFSENSVHKNGVFYAVNSAINRLNISDLEVVKNEFVLSSIFIDSLKEKHSLYTKNEKQEKLLMHFSALSSTINEMSKLGVNFNDRIELYEIGFIKKGNDGNGYSFEFEPTAINYYR
jgi:hypothetical protein